jgi:hypothetical protein
MATRTFQPDATLTAQVATVTVGGTPYNGDVFAINLDYDGAAGHITYAEAGADATVEDIVDAFVAAWVEADNPLVTLAKASASTLTITAVTAGTPFYIKVTKTSDNGTIAAAITTANASPNDWNVAGNWSGDTLPTDGDTVIFAGTPSEGTGITQGLKHDGEANWLPTRAAVALAAIKRLNTYSGVIGLAGYPLIINASAVDIGQPSGETFVAAYMNINLRDSAAVVNVHEASNLGGSAGLTLTVNDDAADVRIWSGVVALANGQCNKLLIGDRATVTAGTLAMTGTTPSITNLGGILSLTNSDATSYTLKHLAGTTTISGTATCSQLDCIDGTARWLPDAGSANVTTANIYGGTAHLVGDVTTLAVMPDGTADFLSATEALTVTGITAHAGSTVKYDPNVVTMPGGWPGKAVAVEMQA